MGCSSSWFVVSLLLGGLRICWSQKSWNDWCNLAPAFTQSRCCDVRWGEFNQNQCFNRHGKSQINFETCCTPRTLVDAVSPEPFYYDRSKKDANLDPESQKTYDLIYNCVSDSFKSGLLLELQSCAALMDRWHNEVVDPPTRMQLVGMHHPLVLRTGPFANALLPFYDLYHKSRLFPSKLWGFDEQAQTERALLGGLVAEGNVVVDAGANVGALTQLFALAVGHSGQVHSFEPMRQVFQLLNANVALGGFANVWTYQKALGDKPETVSVEPPSLLQPGSDTLFTSLLGGEKSEKADAAGGGKAGNGEKKEGWGFMSWAGTGTGSAKADSSSASASGDAKEEAEKKPEKKPTRPLEKVEVVTLDSLDLPRLDVLKMDTEGYEWKVMKGGEQTIRKHKPIVIAEIKPQDRLNVHEFLVEELGYDCHNVLSSMISEYLCIPPHRRSSNFVQRALSLWIDPQKVAAACSVCRKTPLPLTTVPE
uniref:Methyltransferase FkbM domain-containing protein n=1 Tax=Chromera velia CCMP2878 TaxID=1169474 RepID=A0A0G4I8E4_9ALVE|mmetsp:Transcript_19044/g.38485  ORF Transcript_19044/g.38485 Transcript_19044/m.38485 type:complete len:479 (-) Transcript_19044:97-1533(-)|eukprot:Cvel_11833.t1-p1 / transcript=Cvel_11833.t1 / gene=Cvel_11833 / organism=Chromera_velia_CCMP2878 / gene_product=hypothetical protein / transcript_product=hypothetical protein / location=Cvel_scaffold754:32546-38463(+) / protein_length=478 / sequence_SO=supercontig / SO=protein_coding / is_pseudo=false